MPNKNILNIIKLLLFLGILVPLLFDKGTIFPFIFSKIIFFRVIVDLAVLLFVWTLWKKPKTQLILRWPDILLLVFVLWSMLSSLWGVDLQYSWWTGQERMSGLVSILHFVAYLYLLVNIFSTKDWLYFLRGILLVGLIIFLKSVGELGGGNYRAAGSLGNPIYLGEYFLYLFWLAGLLFFISKNKIERWIMICFLLLGIAGIFISGSRGPLLSLVVALLVYFVWYIFQLKKNILRISLGGVGIMLAIVVALGIFAPQISLVQKLPIINNLSELKNFSGSLTNRLIVSGIAWQAALERPFGWGWENFTTAFNIHYNPELLKRGWGDTYFDSAHNLYLDILVGTGFVGLILWLTFFFFIIYSLWHLYKKSENEKNKFILLIAFVISILTQFFVAFLHPSGYFLLFVVLAYIFYCLRQESASRTFTFSLLRWFYVGVLSILALLVTFYCYQNIKAYNENKQQQLAYRNIVVYKNLAETEALIKASWGSWGPYRRDILRNYVEYIESIGIGDLPADYRAKYIQIVKDLSVEIEQDIAKNNTQSLVEYESVLRLQIILWGVGEKNENKINEVYQKLLAINDKHQRMNFTYFNYLAISEQWDQAIALLDKVISDEPDVYDPYWYKVKIYTYLADYARAYDNYILAKDRGFVAEEADMVWINLIEKNRASSTIQVK